MDRVTDSRSGNRIQNVMFNLGPVELSYTLPFPRPGRKFLETKSVYILLETTLSVVPSLSLQKNYVTPLSMSMSKSPPLPSLWTSPLLSTYLGIPTL